MRLSAADEPGDLAALGFVPPAQFGHLNPLTYAGLILAGLLAIGILPPLLMDRLRKPGWRAASDGSE
jgi:hypothetical protein